MTLFRDRSSDDKLQEAYTKITENFETIDKALEDFASLVRQGGKFQHKGVSDFLLKQYGVGKPISKIDVKQVMDELENWNYHTETAMLNALKDGRKKDADILVMIAIEHHKIGHMPKDLSNLRIYINNRKSFVNFMQTHYGLDKEKITLSPNTSKILKKMDKKDAETFLSLYNIL
jgi:hypothetical protein